MFNRNRALKMVVDQILKIEADPNHPSKETLALLREIKKELEFQPENRSSGPNSDLN